MRDWVYFQGKQNEIRYLHIWLIILRLEVLGLIHLFNYLNLLLYIPSNSTVTKSTTNSQIHKLMSHKLLFPQ